MKKLIVLAIVAGAVVGGYFLIKRYGQINIGLFRGETATVIRGDLDVPITASGRIEPASVTKIKGEASGVVKETPQKPGEMVRKDDLIVGIDPEDEQRNVDRAEADHERAKIALERARIAQEEAEKVGLPLAEAEQEQAQARLDFITIEWKQKGANLVKAPDVISRQEGESIQSRLKEAQATVAAAAAKVKQAEIAMKYAAKDVATMEQNERVARKTLEDARERLAETEVQAPIDGMVLKRHVEVGEVVQSGKTSIMGGDVLVELADVSEIYAVVNVDEADIGLVRQLAPPQARPGPPDPLSATRAAGEDDDRPASGPAGTRPAEENPASRPVELPAETIDTTQTVEVTVETFPNERFYGVIERIAPQSEFSQAIATFKVWIRITSPNKSMLIGVLNVQAEAHFTAKSVRDALLVSYDAFQRNPEGEGFGVYVPLSNPQTGGRDKEFRPCKFGRDNGIYVEVLEGLSEGEEVYVKLPLQTRKEREESGED